MKIVSVCIAAYNAEPYIKDSILSVVKQTYENLEIIICDDGSTDNTLGVLNSINDDRIQIFKNTKNKGYLKTFNFLLNKANGDFISFLDADDYLSLNKISMQVEFFNENPTFSLVGTSCNRVDRQGRIFQTETYPTSHQDIINEINYNSNMPFCGSSVMIKSDVRDLIGGYRSFFDRIPFEDFDWIARISEKFNCANLNQALYYYRFSEGSLTRKVEYDPIHRNAKSIVLFLIRQRKNDKSSLDALSGGNINEFQSYLNQISESLNDGGLYKSTAIEHAINKDIISTFKDFGKFCAKNSASALANIKLLCFLIVLLCAPTFILLRVKAFFGLNNVSKKL